MRENPKCVLYTHKAVKYKDNCICSSTSVDKKFKIISQSSGIRILIFKLNFLLIVIL